MNEGNDTALMLALAGAFATARVETFAVVLFALVIVTTGLFFGHRTVQRTQRTPAIRQPDPATESTGRRHVTPSEGTWGRSTPPAANNPGRPAPRTPSLDARLRKGVFLAAALAALLVLLIYRTLTWRYYGVSVSSLYFSAVAVYFAFMMFAAVGGGDRYNSTPPSRGRILAIVPSYNEEPANLHQAVLALLDSTVVPDEIHVVDDGSIVPVVPFDHPRVRWLRQDNAGKRAAQAAVLEHVQPGQFDFIVTVDSDSRVTPDAIESALRALADPKVQAVTSVVAVRNRTESIFSRLADLEIISGVFVVRRARARFGAVTPTSGAFSVYRADAILHNLYDYVRSGTFSDDRRMAHYSLLRGTVVAVDGAVVHTDMPTTFRGTWRQRVRWYKGYWKYLPWEAAYLTGWPLALRYASTLNALVFPLAFLWVAVWLPATGRGLYWPMLALWLALLYCQTLTYLRRPGISRRQAVLTWLLLTPLLIPYQLLLVRPAMYWAGLTVSSARWDGHREPSRLIVSPE